MKGWDALRRHLGWKLFLSYLVVIVVLSMVLISAAVVIAPSAFNRHLLAMETMTDAGMVEQEPTVDLQADLLDNFQNAIIESLAIAAVVALVVAVSVSVYVTRRIVTPIQK